MHDLILLRTCKILNARARINGKKVQIGKCIHCWRMLMKMHIIAEIVLRKGHKRQRISEVLRCERAVQSDFGNMREGETVV